MGLVAVGSGLALGGYGGPDGSNLRPLAAKAMLAMFELTMTREVESAFGKELSRLTKAKNGRS